MELPAVNLKAIVFVHWLLTVFACMYPWLPDAYTWANFSVVAMGVWAVAQKDSVDATSMFLIGVIITVVTDILLFALYFADGESRTEQSAARDLFRFSSGMAILSLLLKPLSCFFVYHMYRERGGECTISLGAFRPGARDRSSYQTIDHQDALPEQDKVPPRSY
ncbi:type-1 angiotensin II receptor-associated protein [Bombina bombina]|uniref:type-1 angiotensin II receptor-associated protein n=1 Tax=Bombina bombina TaxID=8345 RepID=UPI00235AFEE0|nr:type-1 angiotensin II receptor-associated protein [Bombina bombina]